MKFSIQKRPDFLHGRFESCQKCKKVQMSFDGGSDHCGAQVEKRTHENTRKDQMDSYFDDMQRENCKKITISLKVCLKFS